MKKAASVYSIIIGFSMIMMWGMLLLTGQVKEIVDEPFRISTHLFSEGLTAILLVWGGLRSLKQTSKFDPIHLVSMGMLLYSTLTAGGYYLQLGDWIMTLFFAFLFTATGIFIAFNIRMMK